MARDPDDTLPKQMPSWQASTGKGRVASGTCGLNGRRSHRTLIGMAAVWTPAAPPASEDVGAVCVRARAHVYGIF